MAATEVTVAMADIAMTEEIARRIRATSHDTLARRKRMPPLPPSEVIELLRDHLACSLTHLVISSISFFWASMMFLAMVLAFSSSPYFSSTSDMLIAPT
ncbi:hypothetical protein D9M72_587600 [compost metagenome]